jgi:serine protease Do
MTTRLIRLIPIVLVVFLVAACGGGGDDDTDATSTPSNTGSTGTSTGATGSSGASGSTGVTGSTGINSVEEVQPAVIQIISQGTFRDPELGLSNGSGAGSGFIISPDGLAVTNNHVVAGAATLKVYIGGDTTKSYNASIVGVSECSDLALIDIRESDPLPYLDWYQGNVTPGIDVYAAGYPLGDPEFTLTRGIVSKARASGESDWASLDYSIEHDAKMQGGNSGGPLVTADGKVLGVDYASSQGTDSSIYYAVPGEIAQDVVDKLKDGDYETIGINGWAVYDESLDISGIWVAGVTAGSPADKAGIMAGDIITSLNGLPMGTDGTMADYCDVFRTHGDDSPMTVEVLRYDTGEILRGEINGDKPIQVVFSPGAQIQEDTNASPSTSTTTYSGYYSITDDLNQIVVDVPNEWNDTDTRPCNVDANHQNIPCITAATNLDGYYSNWRTPGMDFYLFGQENLNDLLDQYAQTDCDYYNSYDYSDPVFSGIYDVWENCGDINTYAIVLAAVPENGNYTALMVVSIVSDADWDALDQLFATFNVLQ